MDDPVNGARGGVIDSITMRRPFCGGVDVRNDDDAVVDEVDNRCELTACASAALIRCDGTGSDDDNDDDGGGAVAAGGGGSTALASCNDGAVITGFIATEGPAVAFFAAASPLPLLCVAPAPAPPLAFFAGFVGNGR